MGLGSCARVPLPPGRTAFLAFLLADLSRKTVPFTPDSFGLPLENEACGTYKYLAVNKPTNPYLDSIEENLEKLRGKLAECAK